MKSPDMSFVALIFLTGCQEVDKRRQIKGQFIVIVQLFFLFPLSPVASPVALPVVPDELE